MLERLHTGSRRMSEDAGWIRVDLEAKLAESPLDICDSLAGTSLSKWEGRGDRSPAGCLSG